MAVGGISPKAGINAVSVLGCGDGGGEIVCGLVGRRGRRDDMLVCCDHHLHHVLL